MNTIAPHLVLLLKLIYWFSEALHCHCIPRYLQFSWLSAY